MRTITITCLLLLTGCGVLQPDATRLNHLHVSHPFASGQQEDSLDMIEFTVEYRTGRGFNEIGCGQKFGNGGFYGPELACSIRTGFYLTGGG